MNNDPTGASVRARIPYESIVRRRALRLPGDARVAVWTIVNVENWSPAGPMPRAILPPPMGQPLLPDMPFLQAFYNQLQGLIVLARELDSQTEEARSEARELTRRRQEVEREGENLRARTMAHLRATYGFTSEQLIKFGINPRPRSTRRQETPVPAPE